jgi:hypothetical protein
VEGLPHYVGPFLTDRVQQGQAKPHDVRTVPRLRRATTFKKIHKTLEAIQDFAEEIFIGVQEGIQKQQHNLKLFRISEEEYFSEFRRPNKL